MAKKTRLNLRVEEDVPEILERLAGSRNKMGDYLSRLLYVVENADALNTMYHIDRRQTAVEDYVAELVVRVRYLERKIAGTPSYGDQMTALMVGNKPFEEMNKEVLEALTVPIRREDEEQSND